jgi:hypothetical protein
MSRGIPMPDKNSIGLAAVMGGLKQTPHVAMSAPYVGEVSVWTVLCIAWHLYFDVLRRRTIRLTQMPANQQTAPGKKKAQPRPQGGAAGLAVAGLAAAAASKAGGGHSATPGGTSSAVGVGAAGGPPKPAAAKKRKPELRVVGAGSGGVNEMQTFLSDETVQWGLLRFTIGSGTFKRNKAILVHFNGEKATGMHKAKMNRNTPEVLTMYGDTAAKLTLEEVAEVSLDNVLTLTSKLFTADAHMELSIADIKSDYEQMLTDSRRNEIEAMIAGSCRLCVSPQRDALRFDCFWDRAKSSLHRLHQKLRHHLCIVEH